MSNKYALATKAGYSGLKVDLGSIRVQLKGVEGAEELIAAFGALGGRAQQNLYRRAIRPGLMAIAKEARALTHNVPVRSGQESRESKGDEDGSLRDEVARAIKLRVGVKAKKGVYGNVAVRYPKRARNENRLGKDRKAALAHLLEWGFTLKTAWRGYPRKQPIEIEGAEFMTSAFERVGPRAERMIRAALQELIRNPGIGKKAFATSMEAVV
jgi:hypothetical protein